MIMDIWDLIIIVIGAMMFGVVVTMLVMLGYFVFYDRVKRKRKWKEIIREYF